MKNLLIFVCLIMLMAKCSYEREIQAEVVIVQLVEMTPYYRAGVEAGCKILWMDTRNGVHYTSFETDFCDDYLIGAKYKFLIKR